jgi:DNA-binding response OmpR family regulator
MHHILVVDDEPTIVAVVRERLEREGFAVRSASSGEDALSCIHLNPPDLLVLDVMLPGLDGFEVLRRLRSEGSALPVIILTARDEGTDRIVGLEMGADDYVVKPFNPRELSARVRAVLRRGSAGGTAPETVPTTCPDLPGSGKRLQFDDSRRRALLDGEVLDLRPREYDLLRFLARHPGQVFSRDALLDHVWGVTSYIGARTVDVHVRRLRRKLSEIAPGETVILTEWGLGYRLVEGL